MTELPAADLVRHWTAWAALGLFAVGYAVVILEKKTHLRKPIPMIVAAGVLWILASVSPVLEGMNCLQKRLERKSGKANRTLVWRIYDKVGLSNVSQFGWTN